MMTMFRFFLFALSCYFMVACNNNSNNTNGNATNTTDSTANASTDGTLEPPTDVKKYEKPDESVEAKCPPPQTMRDLSGGTKKLFYQLTAANSASLSVFGVANVKLAKKEVMVIVDFIQYKDMACGTPAPVRYAVGARLFLHIKQAQGGIKVTELPKLAAGVELGKASVTYSIETLGITGDKVIDLLPGTGDFNVEAYSKVMHAVDQIQKLAKDGQEGVVIDPQIIPVN